MNRAERRRQKKVGIKVRKEPTLNLKVSDFDHMVSHAEKSAKERATAAAIHEIDRQILEHDEAYPERYKLKELCNVDVEALNNEFKEVIHNV